MQPCETMIKRAVTVLAVFLCVTTSLSAGPRTSASYSIPAESIGGGGVRTQSTSYSLNGSAIGEFGGGANPVTAGGAYSAKSGFVGELYDIVGLSVTAPPSNNLNESTSRQLVAAPLADDATTLAPFNAATITWSVVSGPITSISSSGVATAGIVYQTTPATVGGSGQGLSGQLALSILNVNNDDLGTYASDGIDDAWQVQYFGQNNPKAFPNADPDGDGQNNYFEFTGGLVPNDPNSRFVLNIQPISGQPGRKAIVFNPLVAGRTYAVQFGPSLTEGSWNPLTGTTQSDSGSTRTVTDMNASPAPRFYRVQITKP